MKLTKVSHLKFSDVSIRNRTGEVATRSSVSAWSPSLGDFTASPVQKLVLEKNRKPLVFRKSLSAFLVVTEKVLFLTLSNDGWMDGRTDGRCPVKSKQMMPTGSGLDLTAPSMMATTA